MREPSISRQCSGIPSGNLGGHYSMADRPRAPEVAPPSRCYHTHQAIVLTACLPACWCTNKERSYLPTCLLRRGIRLAAPWGPQLNWSDLGFITGPSSSRWASAPGRTGAGALTGIYLPALHPGLDHPSCRAFLEASFPHLPRWVARRLSRARGRKEARWSTR